MKITSAGSPPLAWIVLISGSLLLSSDPALSLQLHVDQQQPATPKSTTITSRRGLLNRACCGLSISCLNVATTLTMQPQEAHAIYNPLNLKGTFWETGELYTKKDTDLPSDPDELLPSITATLSALESLNDLVLDGKFDELLRQLRGGSVSESQLRLRGYALLDQLPEEGDGGKSSYLAEQAFRLFLTRFANLDATVEAAARQSKVDGGLVETLGLAVVSPFSAANEVAKISQEPSMGSDARIQVLASLGETIKALKAFTKAANDAIKKRE